MCSDASKPGPYAVSAGSPPGPARRAANSISAIVRKLHGWELLHLREHAAELERRLDELTAENGRLRSELSYAEDCAASWRDDVIRLMDDAEVGLTQDGRLVKLAPDARAAEASESAVVFSQSVGRTPLEFPQ
jgi:hypothetical protein